ncbi:MAG: lactonase family protein, partial [Gemmataceae bacterium]
MSSFTRSASNGSLSLVTTIGAGAANGPEGLAVSQANNAVYAVNYSDGNIYEYSIDPTTGAISKQSPASIGNNNGGVASGPEQILINSADSLSGNQFAWVTGTADGSINVYSVDPTTGQLTFNGRGTGFTSPLGMAFQAVGSGGYLYVADSGTGLIHSYSVTPSNGGLAEVAGSPVPSLSSGGGTPALLVFDSTNSRLYVDDNVNGIVTAFGATNGVLGYLTQSAAAPGNSLFGMALTSLSTGEFLYTANQAANTLWS